MPVDLKRVSRDTLYIAIFTTITIGAWIGLEVVRSLTKSQLPRVTKQQLEPLPAGLNQEVLATLRQRFRVGEEELQTVTESAKSVSMEVEPEPEATEEGELVEEEELGELEELMEE